MYLSIFNVKPMDDNINQCLEIKQDILHNMIEMSYSQVLKLGLTCYLICYLIFLIFRIVVEFIDFQYLKNLILKKQKYFWNLKFKLD